MTEAQEKILKRVLQRRAEQDVKWGESDQNWYVWNTILGQEIGKAFTASLSGTRDKWGDQMVDIAAVAFAALEYLDRIEHAELTMREVLKVGSEFTD